MMSDVIAIEADITLAKTDLSKAKALTRLLMNKDFKEVISIGYLEKEVLNLVKSKAGFLTDEANEHINKRIDAISFFMKYLQNIELNGSSAEIFIAESEDLIDQIQGDETNE